VQLIVLIVILMLVTCFFSSRVISPAIIFLFWNVVVFFLSYLFVGEANQYNYSLFLVLISLSGFYFSALLLYKPSAMTVEKNFDFSLDKTATALVSKKSQIIIFCLICFCFYLRFVYNIGVPGMKPTAPYRIINFLSFNITTWGAMYYLVMLYLYYKRFFFKPVLMCFILYGVGNMLLGWRSYFSLGGLAIIFSWLLLRQIKLARFMKIKNFAILSAVFLCTMVLFFFSNSYRVSVAKNIPYTKAISIMNPADTFQIFMNRVSMLNNLNGIVKRVQGGLAPLMDSLNRDKMDVAAYHLQIIIGQRPDQINGVSSTGVGSIYLYTGSSYVVFFSFFFLGMFMFFLYRRVFSHKKISLELCSMYILMLFILRIVVGEQWDTKTFYSFGFVIFLYLVARWSRMIFNKSSLTQVIVNKQQWRIGIDRQN